MDSARPSRGPESNSLGKYRLIAELGHGGMAEVYLAVAHGPAGFNKLVVIKLIRPQFAQEPDFLNMFLDEARLAARLNHSNIVQTNEVGSERGRYFMAMEYLEGQPLNRILARGLPMGMHLRVVVDVLAGLHHAHELEDYDGMPLAVVHRDVTPHNVFVTYDGLVKIVDFGIAKAMSSSAETRTGVLKGKVAYMAPEQIRGEPVDRRADIYSVGVVLWEAAAGRRLWKGLTDVAILQRVMSGEIPSPRTVRPDVPARLEEIVMKAMASDRNARYANAIELHHDLEALLESLGERTTTREIGRYVAQKFEQERQKMRAIIDGQLRTAKALPTDEYQALRLPVLEPQGQTLQPGDASGPHGTGPPARDPSAVPALSGMAPLPPPPFNASNTASLTAATAVASTAPADAPPFRTQRRAAVTVLATLAAVVVAVVSWLVTSGRKAAPDVAQGAAAASPADATSGPFAGAVVPAVAVAGATGAASAAAPAAEVEVTLAASPKEARLHLDGKPLEGNPHHGRFPRDDAPHELRAEAEGYLPLTKPIRLDKSAHVEVQLERAAPLAQKGDAAKKPSQAGEPPEEEELDMKPRPRPKRPLDTTNPYGKP